jgi:hypothetical protein
MKNNPPCLGTTSDTITGDRSKLMALLAMATGALALPQASDAGIIFTDLSANPISIFGTNNSTFLIDTLPGTAQLGFCGHSIVSPPMMLTTHSVRASQRGGYVRLKTDAAGFVALAGPGLNWDQIIGVSSVNGTAAIAKQGSHLPDSFDHMYMVFKFKDSTLPPTNNLHYGWIDLGLVNGNGAIPEVKIFGYAYDDTGAQIQTSVVPEPAPMALLALGALTLGVKGLRAWRRQRVAAD